MPYKDKEKAKKYQREWRIKRRKDFFSGKKCLDCGSKENLQLHHRNPDEKEHHHIWTLSEEKRLKEVEKCDVLCHGCHVQAHVKMGTGRGENHPRSILTKEDVIEIKTRLKKGDRGCDIANDFDVGRETIYSIAGGYRWSHINI